MRYLPSIISQKGFSLIEVLVVISSIVLLSGFGFASLVGSQRKQVVEQTASDIKLAIDHAKYNAASRVKRPGCTTNPLQNIEIRFCRSGGCTSATNDYEIFSVCGSQTNSFEREEFNGDIDLGTTSTCRNLRFSILTTTVQNVGGSLPCSIVISKYGITKTLTVDRSGNVGIN